MVHTLARRTTVLALTALVGMTALSASAQQEPAFLWLEGEDPAASTFNNHNWYSTSGIHMSWLSPGSPESPARSGAWLSHYDSQGAPAEARYDLTVPATGTYTFWIRTSVYRVRQWYRVDGSAPTFMDLESDARERINLTHPVLDLRFLAWVRVAALPLTAGRHSLTVGVEAHPAWQPAQSHGGIDAIALVNFPWFPSGPTQPSLVAEPPGEPGAWYPFVAEDDPFDPEAVTDLTRWLHQPAGIHGPVHRVDDALAFGDGTPSRFWGVGAAMPSTVALQERQARWYAKNGVNLVRLHPVEADVGLLVREGGSVSGERILDPAALDRLDRWFAILKQHGIYMDWSPFYPHVVTADDGIPQPLFDELGIASGGKSSSGMVAFVPSLQEAEWAWLNTLLQHRNPYTGLRYVNDPALAILEVHNEDSIFWHFPLNDLAGGDAFPRHRELLQRDWAAWLAGRYADDGALLAAWGPAGSGSRPGDSLSNARMGIYGAWEMEADGPNFDKDEKRRMGDFIRFLAETQRRYYEERGRRIRAAGYEGVLVSTAWMAGGPAADAANVWTDDALDMVDRHGYMGGGEGGHRVVAGSVNADSHLGQPGTGILAAAFDQVEDKPFVMSEWDQMPPNQWKAEIAPLMAFYGLGLQGWDAVIHFHGGAAHMDGGWPRLDSYVTETPHYMGQFPALALAVHRGDIEAGDAIAARRIAVDDLFAGVDPFTSPSHRYGPPFATGSLETPPEAFAMGRITQKAAGGQAPSVRGDWDALWDRRTGVVTSTSGQLKWDTTRRIVTVDSPLTQAVIGFAGGMSLGLGDVTVDVSVSTPFVSLIMTSLDDRPLAQSGRILVSALARDRQTGAVYSADGDRLLDVGAPPLLLEPVQATLTFGGPDILTVRPLDSHGAPRDETIQHGTQTVTLDGRTRTWMFLIERDVIGIPTETPSPTAPSTPPSQTPTPGDLVRRAFLPRLVTIRNFDQTPEPTPGPPAP